MLTILCETKSTNSCGSELSGGGEGIVLGRSCLRGNCPRWDLSGGNCPGSNYPGGNHPGGIALQPLGK